MACYMQNQQIILYPELICQIVIDFIRSVIKLFISIINKGKGGFMPDFVREQFLPGN